VIRDDPADRDSATPPHVVWRIATEVSLHYVEDDVAHCAYVFTSSSAYNLGAGFHEHAQQHLPVFTQDELLAAYDQAADPEGRANALLGAAISSGRKYDEPVFRRIVEALRDRDRRVRLAAVYAISYSPWPEYIPVLREVAAEDADDEVRTHARTMLAVLDEMGIDER
jgi:HEAT repeat protein